MGVLGKVYGGFPAYRYRQLGIESQYLRTYPWPAAWNQLAGKLQRGGFLVDAPKILAKWVAGQRQLSQYINCYSTVYRHLFPLLANRGKVLVLERGSTHPEEYWVRLSRAFRESGLDCSETIPADVEDEIQAGHLSHFVVAGSRMIFESYTSRGYAKERVLLIPYGVDHEFFRYFSRPKHNEPIKIACVGIIGARKGLGRLVRIAEWAQRVGQAIEIRLIGPLQSEASKILSQAPRGIFRVLGVKKGYELLNALYESDLYCLPSYEEGFGISVLEAMSTGIPAIVSNDTGGREAITHGVDGLVLKTFDEAELDRELTPLLGDYNLRTQMGKPAREKIENGFTLQHYQQRLAAEYQRMFEIVEKHGSVLEPAWSAKAKSAVVQQH